ncbi:hypothetical protein [Aquisphaera insulae]|uniref:hypothetical protein n=1 Tax=Aquisphaera insulae TaxID=2712864 RepID=UPI0013EB93B2|nr:hypothetical protein [Aquisphaera insulae]
MDTKPLAEIAAARSLPPPPVFEVRFEGIDLYPEAIPLRALADSLAAIQRLALGSQPDDILEEVLVEGAEAEEESFPVEAENESLRLLSVNRGSAVYEVAGPPAEPARRRLRSLGEILDRPDDVDVQDYMIGPLQQLSLIARRLQCAITLREPGSQGPILAKIGPESFANVSRSLLVSGQSSLIGNVVRVGGATGRRCSLRVYSQHKILFCKVANDTILKQLGEQLFQDVVVSGIATWIRGSWRLRAFTIEGVRTPVQGPLDEAIEGMREAGGKFWDEVADLDEYLEEVDTDH